MAMIVPFSRSPATQPQLPMPDPQWSMMAAAMMHENGRLVQSEQPIQKVNDIPDHIYDMLDDHSKGLLTNGQLHKQLNEQGWSADLRKKNTIDVWPTEGGKVLQYP